MFDLVPARKYIAGKAILLGVVAGNPGRQVVSVAGVDGTLGNEVAALTHIEVDVAIVGANFWFAGIDTEGTADGVAAEQEVLGTPQYLSALDVVEAGHHRPVASLVQVVFKEARRGVAAHTKVLGSYAADAHGINVGVLGVTADTGGVGNQVLHIIEVGAHDEITGQRGDGQGYLHHALFAFGRGDHYLFQFLGNNRT